MVFRGPLDSTEKVDIPPSELWTMTGEPGDIPTAVSLTTGRGLFEGLPSWGHICVSVQRSNTCLDMASLTKRRIYDIITWGSSPQVQEVFCPAVLPWNQAGSVDLWPYEIMICSRPEEPVRNHPHRVTHHEATATRALHFYFYLTLNFKTGIWFIY